MNDQRIQRQIQAVLARYEPKRLTWPALMADSQGNLHVPGQDGWIYVRVGSDKLAWRAFNDRFPVAVDQPCVVGYDSLHPTLLQVLSLGKFYAAADSGAKMIPAVVAHGWTHQLDHPDGGYDPTYIQKQAIVCLLASETDPASMQVNVAGDRYPWQGGWKKFPGALSASLAGYVPTTSGQALYVLISVDGATNLLQYTVGVTWAIYLPPADLSTLIPDAPAGSVPSVAVYLPYGTTALTRTGNLHDVRIIVSPVGGSLLPAVHDHSEDAQGGLLPATSVEVEEIGTATYDDVQDWLNSLQSSVVLEGAEITENAAYDFTIDIALSKGFIKTSDSEVAGTVAFDIAASIGVLAMQLGMNTIYIDYNAGSPIYATTQDEAADINQHDTFKIGRVFRTADGYLHFLESGYRFPSPNRKAAAFNRRVWGMIRADGINTSESSTLALGIAVTDGELWRGLNEFDIPDFDSSRNHAIVAVNTGTKTFTVAGDQTAIYIYGRNLAVDGSTGNDKGYHVASSTFGGVNTDVVVAEVVPSAVADGNLHYDTFVHVWLNGGSWDLLDFANIRVDNVQYNDISTPGAEVLANVTPNQYGIFWVYVDFEGVVLLVYGQDSYKLADAEIATAPATLPDWADEFTVLAAKIIVERNGANLESVSTAWEKVFAQGQSGGGAPTDAQYLTLALDGSLSAERRFVPGAWLAGTDGGADADYDLAVQVNSPARLVVATGALVEYATIQLAINACATSDIVLIPPGAYTENLTCGVNSIKLVAWPALSGSAPDWIYAVTIIGTVTVTARTFVSSVYITGNVTMNGTSSLILENSRCAGNVLDGGTPGDLTLVNSHIVGSVDVDALNVLAGWIAGTRTVAGATTFFGEVKWAETVKDHSMPLVFSWMGF